MCTRYPYRYGDPCASSVSAARYGAAVTLRSWPDLLCVWVMKDFWQLSMLAYTRVLQTIT